MPQRNSGKNDQLSNVILRRSPRFLQIKPLDSEYPKTPFLIEQRRPRVQFSETPLTTGRTIVSSRKRINKSKEEVSEPIKESNHGRKSSYNPQNGPRRSRILNRAADVCEEIKTSRGCNWRNCESNRPITRSCCRDTRKISKKIDYGGTIVNKNRHKPEECAGISKRIRDNSLNNQVKGNKKCTNDDCDPADEGVLDDKMNKGVLSIKEHHVLDNELPKKHINKLQKRIDGGKVDEMPKRFGAKRKRNQAEGNVGNSHGWSKDQELALERAYITANPTPHFWKKVSRLVPGKSAQECFDKIHCSHLTPPQPRSRSRSVGLNLRNSNLPATKLLEDSSFQKAKKPSRRKQKSHVIQRTVRHMLQKQYKIEKDSETDLFSVLEPTLSPANLITTPDCIKSNNGETNTLKCPEGSSTAYKKSSSRFSSSCETTTIVSPPVLKQVKNVALHEKYIDQLNCREANRKAASLKGEKKGMIKHESSVQRKNAIKASKFALIFDANDAINQFQHQQVKSLTNIFDGESGSDNVDDGEDDFS